MNISQAPSLRTHLLGAHPIIAFFIQRLNLQEIIHEAVGHGRERTISQGEALTCLIHNILDSPAPLYRIARWAEPIAPSAVMFTDQQKFALNDDRIARMLDALVSERGRSIWFRIALRIIKQFKIETARIHHDTTTVTFYGQYETSVTAPKIIHGHNKDHRPDLKQFVFGLSVSSDGAVPLNHQVHSGNRSDDTIHRGNLENLRTILGKDDFIYVADSKLATAENLKDIVDHQGKFVTVLPRTRKEDQMFREALRIRPVRWRHIYTSANKRTKEGPPNRYTACAYDHRTAEGFRLIWIRSSAKALLDQDIRQRHYNQARVALAELAARMVRRKRWKRSRVRTGIKRILKQYAMERFITVRIKPQSVEHPKRLRRGRPSPTDPIRMIRSTHLTITVMVHKKELAHEKRTDGVFPLVTNMEHHTKKDILLMYKYQPYVEKRFSQLKSELDIAPIYLKKPHRCAGLVHAYFLSLVVASLIERSVRHGMQRAGIAKLPLFPEGRSTATPTCPRILEAFKGLCWHEFKRGDERVCFPINLSQLQRTLLKLMEVPVELYR